MAWRSTAALLCLLVGCEDSSGDAGSFETSSTPTTKKSGGFSAGLAKDLKDKNGVVAVSDPPKAGDPKPDDPKAGDPKAGDPKAGDAKAGDPKAGDPKAVDAKAGDPKAGDPKAGDPKAVDAKAGDPKAGDPKAGDPKAGDPKAGDPKAGDPKAGDPKAVDSKVKPVDTKVDPKATDPKPAVTNNGPPAINTGAPRVAVKPSAEQAAIKLSLSPNWDRDVGEAGTISLVVKVPGTSNTQVFAFRYGYEDPKAPTDRDAYKKWLAANGILSGGIDRQRGGSWYLEGTDASGASVFRIVVVFGGRKLICGGSLYRDAASNQLGDIRDKTISQAKEICETVAL